VKSPWTYVDLEERRRRLGMSKVALAQRSGVSYPTVRRILGGDLNRATYAHIAAIARSLQLDLEITSRSDAEQARYEQARQKAAALVGLVQGNSALESQAVKQHVLEQLIAKTVQELLASNQKLWAE